MDVCRILVVEDDPIVASHLEAIIEQTIASEILLSTSVAEAVIALRRDIAFAFLDVDVLDGTTYAFASMLAMQSIPFAFLSASNREDVPTELRTAPFVAKPYTPQDIIDLLQAAGKIPA